METRFDGDDLLLEGIEAVKQEDFTRARKALRTVLRNDGENVRAWLWYARALEDNTKRLKAIDKALEIDPYNQMARKMRARYAKRRTTGSLRTLSTQTMLAAEDTGRAYDTDVRRATQPRPTVGREELKVGPNLATLGRRVLYALLAIIGVVLLFVTTETLTLLTTEGAAALQIVDYATLGGAAVLLLAALWWGINALAIIPLSATVHYNGLVIGNRKILWQNVKRIKLVDTTLKSVMPLHVFTGTGYKLTIETEDGKRVTIDKSLDKYKQVGEAIINGAGEFVARRIAKQLRADEKLHFGALEVSKMGITFGATHIAWADIRSITTTETCRTVVQSTYQGEAYTDVYGLWNQAVLPHIHKEMRGEVRISEYEKYYHDSGAMPVD